MLRISTNQDIELLLLGGFEVRFNGQTVAGVSYNKMRALLAYLSMEREQDHSREALAGLLWSNSDPETARGNLRRTLADLRRVLEIPSDKMLFSTSKHTIRFIPDALIDALDFVAAAPSCKTAPALDACHPCLAQMERMAELYRGEFLAGFSLPGCPEFENWLHMQREALHRRALVLLEKLSNCHERLGGYSKALQFALRYAELEPWDENAHRRIMRLYALSGQASAALTQYEVCCRLLKTELDALPCEETRQLAERIRNGELRREPIEKLGMNGVHEIMPQIQAERRQVTVLYCELSTTTDDPDAAMELLHAPQACCVEIIRQFSGHIVQTHGGGLLAYFGYPQADEHAALHAVQAALAVNREVAPGIEIRAGVHTGLIITGGDSSMPDTVGKTSMLAIQLRQRVAYNEVAVSPETYGIVGGYFDCLGLGEHVLPGVARPVEIFRVVRESGARTRLDAAARLTPLVGRRAEVTRLTGLWKKAVQGASHVVLVQGEAGIGKSRLLHTLKQRLGRMPYAIRESRCFPEYRQSPFHPLIAMFEAVFGFVHEDTPEQKSGKLVRYIEAHYPAEAEKTIPLLAPLLSLPLTGRYQASALSPQKQKEQTIAMLLNLMRALVAKQPVLLIIEDLHWIDPSSQELLSRFVEQEDNGTILILLTARPEFVPPWKIAGMTMLTLAHLAEDEAAQMVVSVSADISPATLRQIVERADGVPLFIEEMAKIARLDKQVGIPATLHDLLTARMDRMGGAKKTAQLAAAIGREFDLNLLRKLAPDHAQLEHSLNALQDAGLILEGNGTTRQFKHALIQEAVYQSQVKADRQIAHQRIAQMLLSDFPDIVTTRPEVVAQHLSSGGEVRQAIAYWLKAGQRAAMHSAIAEAIGHFNSGLQILEALLSGEERDRLEAGLQLGLGTALIAAKGYGSTEAGQAYSRALELCESAGDRSGLFNALLGMWFTSSSRVGHAHSLELAEKLLHLAQQGDDVLQLQMAHHAMGNSSFMTGNQAASRIHLEQSMVLYQPSHHEALVSQFGENICVSSASLLSLVLWLQGFSEQAGKASQQAIALARQVNHANSLGYALCAAAILNRWMKQIEATGLLAREAMALSHEHGLPFWLGMGASSYGWAQAMQGHAAGAVQIQQCLDAVDAVMSGAKLFFLAPLCEALVHLGQFDIAQTKINEALVILNAKDSRFFESEFHRLKGVCLLETSRMNMHEAEACYSHALNISRKQGAKSLELRAAMSMAQLWQRQGKQADARRMLEEIYNWFADEFDTPDLQEASGLLRATA